MDNGMKSNCRLKSLFRNSLDRQTSEEERRGKVSKRYIISNEEEDISSMITERNILLWASRISRTQILNDKPTTNMLQEALHI